METGAAAGAPSIGLFEDCFSFIYFFRLAYGGFAMCYFTHLFVFRQFSCCVYFGIPSFLILRSPSLRLMLLGSMRAHSSKKKE